MNIGKVLIFKQNTLSPACVGDKAASDLIHPNYGWAKKSIGDPGEPKTQHNMCVWYPDVPLVLRNCVYDFTTEDYDPQKFHEIFTPKGPLGLKMITQHGDVHIGSPAINDVNCMRYANWLTEFQKEKIDTREDYPRYPPWGNQIFPLVEYCNDNGHFEKNTIDDIAWSFIPTSQPYPEPSPVPMKCKSGPAPSDNHYFDEEKCEWYLISEPRKDHVFPYVWNSYLQRNSIDFSPQETSYANPQPGFYDEKENRVCSPLIGADGSKFYISSTFNIEPLEIIETEITKTQPDDCQRIWKTDIILEEPTSELWAWLEKNLK